MGASRSLKSNIGRIPVVGAVLSGAYRYLKKRVFPGSARYWERRYAQGGTSGAGSRGVLADFKARVLNDFVAEHGVESVVEFGCGDGGQLLLAEYPRYLGLDVSPTILRRSINTFAHDPTKSFLRYDPICFVDPAALVTADMAISLDVIYHLVEDHIYDLHLRHVFGSAQRYVVLFTSDSDTLAMAGPFAPHIRHRPVGRDVSTRFPQWSLRARVTNPHFHSDGGASTSFADFLIYERKASCSRNAEHRLARRFNHDTAVSSDLSDVYALRSITVVARFWRFRQWNCGQVCGCSETIGS